MKTDPVIRLKFWKEKHSPRKVLVMRFQALGDTIITLPYLQSLKRNYPEIELHFFTREEVCTIPKHVGIFDRIITIGGGRNAKLQFLLALLKLPFLWTQRYDVVLDLQKHKISIIVRKLLFVKAWAELDKYSPNAAGSRYQATIESLGLWKVNLAGDFKLAIDTEKILRDNNWKKDFELVALNPAGSFPSRNWPAEYYVSFAKLWLEHVNSKTQFLLLLLPSLEEKAKYIEENLGDHCINLTGKASQIEAFALLQRCRFILSEDSGLMHMAWIQKIPTLALFSSSRKDWSAPQGHWSQCLDSSDLECGPCEFLICKYGDNRCLTRYEPHFVLQRAVEILKRVY
jgi:heptosyltransferase II